MFQSTGSSHDSGLWTMFGARWAAVFASCGPR